MLFELNQKLFDKQLSQSYFTEHMNSQSTSRTEKLHHLFPGSLICKIRLPERQCPPDIANVNFVHPLASLSNNCQTPVSGLRLGVDGVLSPSQEQQEHEQEEQPTAKSTKI